VGSNIRVWRAAPLSPGLSTPYTGQVAEQPKQACGVVEANTPPCRGGKRRRGEAQSFSTDAQLRGSGAQAL